jgi:hypothetical protein
MRKVINMVD